MENNNFLIVIAIVAVGMALLNLGITINKVGDIKSLTGYATDTGTLNFTIEAAAAVVFVTDNINWGSGKVTEGEISATLDSEGNVTNGDWDTVNEGFRLNNTGNCNVSFTIQSGKTAATFIGGTDATPTYKVKVENNETNACGDIDIPSYENLTGTPQQACSNFGYEDDADLVNIEIEVVIPRDATPGAKSDTLTISANCVS
jgi:hypothetical protein